MIHYVRSDNPGYTSQGNVRLVSVRVSECFLSNLKTLKRTK